ncbi:MAG: adenylyltransferase/cytidyltransferase family protein [Candidatus Omnitrophota bacterium]|jgi:cytidyltransferase-like protein
MERRKVKVAIAGGFDPIHAGHIDHIRKASLLGDYLVVIVARDIQLIKKKGYCFLPLAERLEIVRAIKGVNEVVVNIDKDLGCAATLELIKPDIFAKGGDRIVGNIPYAEVDICNKINCRLVYGVGDSLNSSQAIVEKAIHNMAS